MSNCVCHVLSGIDYLLVRVKTAAADFRIINRTQPVRHLTDAQSGCGRTVLVIVIGGVFSFLMNTSITSTSTSTNIVLTFKSFLCIICYFSGDPCHAMPGTRYFERVLMYITRYDC